MKTCKSIVMVVLALIMCIGLTACSGDNTDETMKDIASETKTEEPTVETVDLTTCVTGIRDLTVEVGDKPDWMSGIKYDEKYVASIDVDDSKVDLAKAGSYKLTYTIKPVGDIDAETVTVTVTVKVEMTDAEKAEEEENAAKAESQTPTPTPDPNKGSSSGSNNNSSAGNSGSNSGSSSGNSGSSSSNNDKPAAHTHTWKTVVDVPATTKTVVDVPETTKTVVDVPEKTETKEVAVCVKDKYGNVFSSHDELKSAYMKYMQALAIAQANGTECTVPPVSSGYNIIYETRTTTIPAVTHEEKVPAVTHEEKVPAVTHQECSTCGARK